MIKKKKKYIYIYIYILYKNGSRLMNAGDAVGHFWEEKNRDTRRLLGFSRVDTHFYCVCMHLFFMYSCVCVCHFVPVAGATTTTTRDEK
jgi:hypothetical protein